MSLSINGRVLSGKNRETATPAVFEDVRRMDTVMLDNGDYFMVLSVDADAVTGLHASQFTQMTFPVRRIVSLDRIQN